MRRSAQYMALSVPLLVLLLSSPGYGASLAAAPPVLAPQSVPTQPLEQHKSLGAVRLTLTADRPSMGLTDTLTLTLTIVAPLRSTYYAARSAQDPGAF